MNTFTKIIAGLSVATVAALSMNAPAQAAGNNDWDTVGYSQHLDGGGTMRFDIPFDGGCTAIISVVGADYDDDLDLRIVYPDGYTVYASDYGDDEIWIDTERGGNFDIYVDNAEDWHSDFTLRVEYA
jgi:hypothetical protein